VRADVVGLAAVAAALIVAIVCTVQMVETLHSSLLDPIARVLGQ